MRDNSRNCALFKLACRLRAMGWEFDEIFHHIRAHPERRGLERRFLRDITKSACRYPAGDGIRLGQHPFFPSPIQFRAQPDRRPHISKPSLRPVDWLQAQWHWRHDGRHRAWILEQLAMPAGMTIEQALERLQGICGTLPWYDHDVRVKRPAIVLPFRTAKGEPTGAVKVRFIELRDEWPQVIDEGGVASPAAKSKSYGPVNLLGIDRVDSFDLNQPLYVLAGEKDLMSAILHGIPAIAVAGENICKVHEDEAEALRRFKQVVVLYDRDPAGLEAAPLMARRLQELGVAARWLPPSPAWPGKDLTDWLQGVKEDAVFDA